MNSSLVDELLDKKNKDNYKSVIKQFEKKKTEILSENEELLELIYQSKKTTKWVNWIDDFKDQIVDLLLLPCASALFNI